jgi:hypothetical protein
MDRNSIRYIQRLGSWIQAYCYCFARSQHDTTQTEDFANKDIANSHMAPLPPLPNPSSLPPASAPPSLLTPHYAPRVQPFPGLCRAWNLLVSLALVHPLNPSHSLPLALQKWKQTHRCRTRLSCSRTPRPPCFRCPRDSRSHPNTATCRRGDRSGIRRWVSGRWRRLICFLHGR